MAIPTELTEIKIALDIWTISKVAVAFIGIIGVLCGYIWKKQDKTIEHLQKAQEDHDLADDKVHDQLFSEIRKLSKEVSRQSGVCETNHKG